MMCLVFVQTYPEKKIKQANFFSPYTLFYRGLKLFWKIATCPPNLLLSYQPFGFLRTKSKYIYYSTFM